MGVIHMLTEFSVLFLHEVFAQSRSNSAWVLYTCSLNSLHCFCVKFLPSPDHMLTEFSVLFLHEVFAQSRSDSVWVLYTCSLNSLHCFCMKFLPNPDQTLHGC